MENELESRALPNAMPLRQAFVENLVRASLDGAHTMIWPKPHSRPELRRRSRQRLRAFQRTTALPLTLPRHSPMPQSWRR